MRISDILGMSLMEIIGFMSKKLLMDSFIMKAIINFTPIRFELYRYVEFWLEEKIK